MFPFKIIISPHVPREEHAMYMLLPNFPRFPWQAKYKTFVHKTFGWKMLFMPWGIVVMHPDAYYTALARFGTSFLLAKDRNYL